MGGNDNGSKKGCDPPAEIWDAIVNIEKDVAVLKNDLSWVKKEVQELKRSWDRLKWAIIGALISLIPVLVKMFLA